MFAMKLLGESEIEEALQRMDQLTQEAVQIGVAETLAAVHGLSDNMRVIMGMILLETGITCADLGSWLRSTVFQMTRRQHGIVRHT